MTPVAPLELHPDRLSPPDPEVHPIAHRLCEGVRASPIVSPQGHVDDCQQLDDVSRRRKVLEL